MILARCPACSTTFRVRPEQLSARQGRVRCGQCKHAFNALENQVEEEALADDLSTPPSVPADTAPPLFVLEEKQAEDTPVFAEPAEDATELPPPLLAASPQVDDDRFEAPPFVALDEDAPLRLEATPAQPDDDKRMEPVGDIAALAPTEWSALDGPASDEHATPDETPFADTDDEASPLAADEHAAEIPPFPFKPDWPDASELDLKPPAADAPVEDSPLDFDSLLHKKDVTDTPGTPLLALEPEIPPAPTPVPSIAPQVALPIESPPPPEELAEQADDEDDEAAATEEAEESHGPSALQQAAWAAGATLLVLALLAQGVLVFRGEIAQSSPQMRLFMESVCAGMGCELPLPNESSAITIESSDIQPDANREAFFTLHATLRNRAEFAQAWPHLEVTLTDARDKALVRRVLEPRQWLPADAPKDAFPARREIAARVSFEAPGVAAAGYRVYAFYP